MTCERLLCYPSGRWYSPEFLLMSFVCSFQRGLRSKVIPVYFTFLDHGIEWLNNLSLGRRLCERRVKNIVDVLARPMETLHFVNVTWVAEVSAQQCRDTSLVSGLPEISEGI
jgi:hypothetical protein